MSETTAEYMVVRKSEVQDSLSKLKKEVLKVLYQAYPNRLQPSQIAKILGLPPDKSRAYGSGGYEMIRGVLHYLCLKDNPDPDVHHVKGRGWLITDSGKNKVINNVSF